MSARVVTALAGASEAKRLRAGVTASATDSTSVFQAPQCGHLPSQLRAGAAAVVAGEQGFFFGHVGGNIVESRP
jgi:hypothetical protein